MITELIIYFIAGTIAGSFFFTLALRYSDGSMKENPLRALFSRSRCNSCGKTLSAVSLIPLAGYALSMGRCRVCGKPVSPVYPVMEILYGLLAVLVAQFHGTGIMSFFVYLIISTSVVISVVDVRTMNIPPSLVVILAILTVFPVVAHNNYMDSLYGFLLLGIFFLAVMLIFPGAFGGGDLKLYAVAGFMFGLELSIVLLEVSLVVGALCGIALALARGGRFRMKMPFAPFITAGIIITFLFGDTILLFYYTRIYGF